MPGVWMRRETGHERMTPFSICYRMCRCRRDSPGLLEETNVHARSSLAFLILAFAASASASIITFSVGVFTPGTWADSVVTNVNTTSSSHTFAQFSTGGDPTFYEDDVHSFTGTNAGMRLLNES